MTSTPNQNRCPSCDRPIGEPTNDVPPSGLKIPMPECKAPAGWTTEFPEKSGVFPVRSPGAPDCLAQFDRQDHRTQPGVYYAHVSFFGTDADDPWGDLVAQGCRRHTIEIKLPR